MKFSIHEKTIAILALNYAIQWEDSIIDAYSTCYDDDETKIQVTKDSKRNIMFFEKLKKRFVHARKYSA